MSRARWLVAALGAGLLALSLWNLWSGLAGIDTRRIEIGETPATVYRAEGAPPAPVVVIAHGFAGSRPLMEPFALTLAQNGYLAVSFDFRGHGRNPLPLTGDVTAEDGATLTLLDELRKVIDHARDLPGSDGRVAVLGHSMASDIVVRAGVADPEIAATVAVSMFSEAATAEEPRNLLIIVGGWEDFLGREALKVAGLAAPGGAAEEGVTYGDPAEGTGRRAVFADSVEHVGVLFARESQREALDWLDATFGRSGGGSVEARGLWIVGLLTGIVALGWPLAALLPRVAERPVGRVPRRWVALAPRAILPALLTPLILWPLDVRFLPVLVADYLAVHFVLYGLITIGLLALTGPKRRGGSVRLGALAVAALGTIVWTVGVLGLGLDAWVASFWPHAGRVPLIGALLVGTALYILSDEWLTRGSGAPRGAYAFTKLCMLGSLALAVSLNLEKLFFLIIILPVILLFFLLYGLFSGWVYRATGHPAVAGIANAVAFAWALGVTFPLLGS